MASEKCSLFCSRSLRCIAGLAFASPLCGNKALHDKLRLRLDRTPQSREFAGSFDVLSQEVSTFRLPPSARIAE